MHDLVIRESLYRKVLSKYTQDTNTKIINELGMNHGSSRADVAVVNGIMHGYEIKSDFDNLIRLPMQAEAYSKIFDKVTLVVGVKHLEEAIKIIPSWWGIKVVQSSKNNKLKFISHRRATLNSGIDSYLITKLLWRSEAVEMLSAQNVSKSILRKSKEDLYQEICLQYNAKDIKKFVHKTLKERKCWRDH